MRRIDVPYIGTATTDAFLIEAELIGLEAAIERVVGQWSAGAALHELRDGLWILVLPTVIDIRSERSPGLPLLRNADGSCSISRHGFASDVRIETLPRLEPAHWIDLEAYSFDVLLPLSAPPPPIEPMAVAEPVRPADLRSLTGIKSPTAEAGKLLADVGGVELIQPNLGASFGDRAAGMFSNFLMKTPMRSSVSRKHRKYLNNLADQFQQKNYDEALRNAIGLGGIGGLGGFLTMRVPRRRDSLGMSMGWGSAGGSVVPYDSDVQTALRTLYEKAAKDLEAEGRIEEAAFVFVELLSNTYGAVDLLERNKRYALAAQLAEGYEHDAASIVRLWWLAGEREHAIDVARVKNAFGYAIRKLEHANDFDTADQLRVEWADSLRRGGDFAGAVLAVWPREHLRARALADIATGISLGGPVASQLFAYQLALVVTPDSRDAAAALITTDDPDLLHARDEFLYAFSEAPACDAAADRQLASVAIRLLTGLDPQPQWGDLRRKHSLKELRRRCDPLLNEDAPRLVKSAPPTPESTVQIQVSAVAGDLPILDAAVLPGRTILAAHGTYGLRLLSFDGRTRAQWDVRADQLVLNDTGSVALIGSSLGENQWLFHRLDLATRKLTQWTRLEATIICSTFNGMNLVTIDGYGVMNVIDTLSATPRTVWREREREGGFTFVTRDASSMAAIVWTFPDRLGAQGYYERWVWELPSMTLRSRSRLEINEATALQLCSDGTVGEVMRDELGSYRIQWRELHRVGQETSVPSTATCGLAASGRLHGHWIASGERSRVEIFEAINKPPVASVSFTSEMALSMRSLGGHVAIWDQEGRIAAIDVAQRSVLAQFRTRT